jgi:hypothetical protein
MTNPAAAMRLLITYAICVVLAIFLGYMMTEIGGRPDYPNLIIVGLLLAVVLMPVFIKWHYPIMIFGLGCPMYVFFLPGDPPLAQIVVIISLGIAIVERTLNRDRRFISVPSMTWPLLFIAVTIAFTMKLTGGLGLHALGSSAGGGKKYIAAFIGIGIYFALTSRVISKRQRNLYIALYFLAGLPSFISDLFPLLPSPLNYINLLFPPSQLQSGTWSIGTTRLGAFATTAGVVANFMLAKYGLRGIFMGGKLWRLPVFALMLILTLLGGFRIVFATYAIILFLLFFMEKLYRTRLLLVFGLGGVLGLGLLIPFSNKLPFTFQRAMSFLPLKWDADATLSAEDSLDWRLRMWHDLWPKVPDYLLLGKGYSISQLDMEMIGRGSLANGYASTLDASQDALAISGDYHSGPLSTLIPFGIWGAIGILWLMAAGLRVLYQNYKYGDLELKTVNTLFLAFYVEHIIGFFFLFGAFQSDVGEFAKVVGFSVALNWGVRKPNVRPATIAVSHFKHVRQTQPQPA